MTDTVTVPRELLQQVLDAAEADSRFSQESQHNPSLAEMLANIPRYAADRARIAQLRKAAGLEE